MKKLVIFSLFILLSVCGYGQTTITAGMTQLQFFTAINANFSSINITSGSQATLTTISASTSYTVINGNFDALNAVVPTAITIFYLYPGMSGTAYINALNTNFINLVASFNSVLTQSNTIYVSNSGNDGTGNGTIITPYATLVKATTVLTDNTKILIAKGSTFINDKLDLSGKTNIFVDSYGNGIAPILTALKSVTGWTDEGDNIWSKQDNNFPSEITNVFIGGTKAILARKTISTATAGNQTTLTDSGLEDADGFWNNAELYIDYNTFLFGMSRVSAYASKTFTIPGMDLDPEHIYNPSGLLFPVVAGYTYYVQNHRGCLTTQNQYAYNNSTKTLYVYSTTQPSGVTVTYGDDCIYGNICKNITIQNLDFESTDQCDIQIKNSSYINILNITSNYAGYYPILLKTCQVCKVDGCTMTDQNSDGIMVMYCNQVILQNNIINKCGYTTGSERYLYGIFPGQNGNGIGSKGTTYLSILYNEIYNTNYSGICLMYATNPLIQYNYVHDVNLIHFDGGAIYMSYSTNGHILNNICTNGTVYNWNAGIYIDLSSLDNEIDHNFVTGYTQNVMIGYEDQQVNFHDNVLFSTNSTNNIWFTLYGSSANNTINNNLFVAQAPATCSIGIYTALTNTETITNNKYYYPFGKAGTGGNNTMFKLTTSWLTLAQWIADENTRVWGRTALNELEITPSMYAGSAKPETDFLIYLINPAKTVRIVQAAELPYSDYVDMDGVAQTYPFTMQPYTSKVLVRPN